MNKKAQFYILAAVILLTIAFTVIALSTRVNSFKKRDTSFEELNDNYIREVSEVINNIVYEKNQNSLEEISLTKLNQFTKEFLDYAHTKQPSYSLAYVFSYYGDMYVMNEFDEEIVFSLDGEDYNILSGESINLNSSDNYVIYAFDNKYEFEKNQDVDIDVLFKSTQGNEVRIFAHE